MFNFLLGGHARLPSLKDFGSDCGALRESDPTGARLDATFSYARIDPRPAILTAEKAIRFIVIDHLLALPVPFHCSSTFQ